MLNHEWKQAFYALKSFLAVCHSDRMTDPTQEGGGEAGERLESCWIHLSVGMGACRSVSSRIFFSPVEGLLGKMEATWTPQKSLISVS